MNCTSSKCVEKAQEIFFASGKYEIASAAPQFSSVFHTTLTTSAYPRSCASWAGELVSSNALEFAIPHSVISESGSLYEVRGYQPITSILSGFLEKR